MSESNITPIRSLEAIEREVDSYIDLAASTFMAIGKCLTEIHDNDLWVGGEYDTWAAYVNGRFKKTKRWANQTIHSYKALMELDSYGAREEVNRWDRTQPPGEVPDGSVDPEPGGNIVPTLLNEAQARELAKIVDPAERQEVHDAVVTDIASGKKVTAKSIASGGGVRPKKSPYMFAANAIIRIPEDDGGPREERTLDWMIATLTAIRNREPRPEVPEFITVDKPFIDIMFEANYCQIRGSWGVKQLIEEVGGHPVFSNVTHSWGCSMKHGRDLLALLETRKTHVVRVEG